MAIKGSVRAPYVIEVHVPETINVNVNIPGLQENRAREYMTLSNDMALQVLRKIFIIPLNLNSLI